MTESGADGDDRESFIVDTLVKAFSDLMEADPDAFRTKFRKMAADVVAFGLEYAGRVRDDHRHFVEAFREGRIPGVTAT